MKIRTTTFVFTFVTVLVIILTCFTWFCNRLVDSSTSFQIYKDATLIPYRRVGILLGTNKSWHGKENPFFKYRIEAAVALFAAGKVKRFIVSGDNHLTYYDEALDMKKALMKAGVPDTLITLDFAGFRTFDSMVRCLKVFCQDSVTVISQENHTRRALFIANYLNMKAVGFCAKDPTPLFSLETNVREYFAKCKAVLDLYLFHSTPHFLGEKVKL
jgi:SanA protein